MIQLFPLVSACIFDQSRVFRVMILRNQILPNEPPRCPQLDRIPSNPASRKRVKRFSCRIWRRSSRLRRCSWSNWKFSPPEAGSMSLPLCVNMWDLWSLSGFKMFQYIDPWHLSTRFLQICVWPNIGRESWVNHASTRVTSGFYYELILSYQELFKWSSPGAVVVEHVFGSHPERS